VRALHHPGEQATGISRPIWGLPVTSARCGKGV